MGLMFLSADGGGAVWIKKYLKCTEIMLLIYYMYYILLMP
jgi:hypothetical protein